MENETEQIFIINPSENQSSTQKLIEIPGTTQDLESQNVEDFSNACRTCASNTEFVIPIFDGEGLQNNLAEKIHKHLPIQVSEHDVLPRVVCYQCASTLLAWHELVQCCIQADNALRTRLTALQSVEKEQSPIDVEAAQTTEAEPQNKFENISDLVVRAIEPPQYPASPPQPIKSCTFCNLQFPENNFTDHLITTHAEFLFHCEECNTYVDRKDFVPHMALHALQYAMKQDKKEEKTKKVKKKKDENQTKNTDKTEQENKDLTTESMALDKKDKDNEFSDHSDVEYFSPLPESVFEAIEDSQDSQLEDQDATSPTSLHKDEHNGVTSNSVENYPKNKTKSSQNKKPRTCPICSKVYTASSSYFYHVKHQHQQTNEHRCEVCDKTFRSKAILAEHASIHTGERKHLCGECGKRFRSKASLYIHAQSHGGAKQWQCGACGRAFRWRAQLARHASRHAASRQHACGECGRGFSVRGDLLRHARTHRAGAFRCDKCLQTFAQQRYLNVHVNNKHSLAH